jgi:hypothetical protein
MHMPAASILLSLYPFAFAIKASKIAWLWAEMKKNTRFLQKGLFKTIQLS